MNKHIVGFILFNIIVGASAIAAALFYEMPKIESVSVPEVPVTYTGKSCWKNFKMPVKGEVSTRVIQAVFDENTNELDMDLFLERKNHSTESADVTLDFFVKTGSQTRYVASERVNLTPKFNLEDKAAQNITSSYQWLNDLKSHENLYVVPQWTFDAENNKRPVPRFDELNAAPVTVVEKN